MLPIYVSYFMQKNAVDCNKKMASIRLQQARNNWSHWKTNKAKLNLQYLPKYSKKCSPAMLSMKISPQDMFALISNCSNYLILDNSYKLELVIMMRHHDLPFVADFDRWYTTKGESWPWISSFDLLFDAAEVMMVRPPTIWRLVRLRKRWYNIVLYKNFGEMWLALSLRKISNEKLRLRAWNWRLLCLFNL